MRQLPLGFTPAPCDRNPFALPAAAPAPAAPAPALIDAPAPAPIDVPAAAPAPTAAPALAPIAAAPAAQAQPEAAAAPAPANHNMAGLEELDNMFPNAGDNLNEPEDGGLFLEEFDVEQLAAMANDDIVIPAQDQEEEDPVALALALAEALPFDMDF